MPSTEADRIAVENRSYLHIAVGVVADGQNRILISERKADCAYAGQWEFPGGKVEVGEDVAQALARELNEELGLSVQQAHPLIRIRHEYPDRRVLLDTWRVSGWHGQPESREGQRFAWVPAQELDAYPMLAANRPIVRAAQLPDSYLITPECEGDGQLFLRTLEARLAQGVRLVRLRQTEKTAEQYRVLARAAASLCDQAGARLMLDDPESADNLQAGLHLNSRQLMACAQRPKAGCGWVAASCHNQQELQQAEKLGCDFAVLGAVATTPSHPGIQPLGWETFGRLVDAVGLPVYALGGMAVADLEQAWRSGAQGVAAIRGLWTGN